MKAYNKSVAAAVSALDGCLVLVRGEGLGGGGWAWLRRVAANQLVKVEKAKEARQQEKKIIKKKRGKKSKKKKRLRCIFTVAPSHSFCGGQVWLPSLSPFWPLLPRSLALIFPFVLAFKNALPCERCTWKNRITLGKVEAYGFYKKLGELMP